MFAPDDESADSGHVTGVTLFAGRVRWYIRALGRNPLVRLVDRLEALAVLGVLAVAFAALPAVMSAGTIAYEDGIRTAEREAQSRHSVQALVVDGVGLPTEFDTPAYVTAQWQEGPRTRTELIVAPATVKPGDHTPVWLDDAGRIVAAPQKPGDATVNAVAVAVTLWTTVVAASALLAYLVRRGLDRARERAWNRELLLLAHNDDGWANRRG